MPDQKHIRLLIKLVLLTLLIAFIPGSRAFAQEIVDPSVEYIFGEQVIFSGTVQSEVPVKEIFISFRTRNETDTFMDRVEILPGGELVYIHPIEARALRAFTIIDYWFTIRLDDGTELNSSANQFEYADNRFAWQTIEETPFEVYWFDGDIASAQGVIDVAREGLNRAQGILPLQKPAQIRLYIYKSADQIPQIPGNNWVAGHAYPDLELVVVSIPDGPERRLEMERQIPHELMHVLLFQTAGAGYSNLPTWLVEGLATMAQLYPTPEYQVLLENGIKTDSLLPISSLCQGFPAHASGAYLAYAEAAYFTRYIYHQYGSSGLERLVTNYSNGVDCERGAELALGVTLSRLEHQWVKESLGLPAVSVLDKSDQFVPWFFLLAVVLVIPLGAAAAGLLSNQHKQAQY